MLRHMIRTIVIIRAKWKNKYHIIRASRHESAWARCNSGGEQTIIIIVHVYCCTYTYMMCFAGIEIMSEC